MALNKFKEGQKKEFCFIDVLKITKKKNYYY